LFEQVDKRPGVRYRALWLNPKGLERALANGRVDIDGKLTLTVSETFVKRNTNRSIDETFDQMPAWIQTYRDAGVEADALGVMAAFGCNFEGYIPEERVIGLIARAIQIMADNACTLRNLSLADTMGWGSPGQIKSMVGKVRDKWPELKLKLHLHDTRGCAVANAVAAIELGVNEFDASVGGLVPLHRGFDRLAPEAVRSGKGCFQAEQCSGRGFGKDNLRRSGLGSDQRSHGSLGLNRSKSLCRGTRRLPLRGPQRRRRQRVHGGPGFRVRRDGHRHRRGPRPAGGGSEAYGGAGRPRAARQGHEGRDPHTLEGAPRLRRPMVRGCGVVARCRL